MAGFIGVDKSDAQKLKPTAPLAPQEAQQDVVTTHDIYYDSNGIACCSGSKGE